ncbi:hypothetical protein [Mesorhizobium sp. M0909]|uniref:hypothetical protein n=1 Tax=Mesorhizobium sp. M0909 TaxID=2957024 RepID=UPI0033357BB3
MTFDDIRRRDWVRTYPTREQALTLVGIIKSDDWSGTYELDKRLKTVTGIEWSEDFGAVAERCFEVYGYPELEAGYRARRIAEVSMRPSKPSAEDSLRAAQEGPAGGSGRLSQPSTPNARSVRPTGPELMTYGFSPRR